MCEQLGTTRARSGSVGRTTAPRVGAEKSREAENILKFCHWRQVERLIDALASDEPQGTVH